MEKSLKVIITLIIAIVIALTMIIIFTQGNLINKESLNKTINILDWRV